MLKQLINWFWRIDWSGPLDREPLTLSERYAIELSRALTEMLYSGSRPSDVLTYPWSLSLAALNRDADVAFASEQLRLQQAILPDADPVTISEEELAEWRDKLDNGG